ncbi:MAG: 50S ribosomal protein L3 N(5)-glutamine methyltransferase [Pseudomonadaceae bacterium]|nr:50S ribosomal protein L3 N(5)-glutamine methyltransferase [Pseudomonadaceae bacterium]
MTRPESAPVTVAQKIAQVHAELDSADLYFGHGTDNAWDEAVALVTSLAQVPDERSSLERELSTDVVERIDGMCARRISERIPLPYLLGYAWFCGLRFDTHPNVLIPRSPIGELIVDGFAPWLAREPASVLDLCCGSGCIGIACALRFPDACVTAADIDDDALKLAAHNARLHSVSEGIAIVRGDGLGAVTGQRFDLIICNPPYVDAQAMAERPPEYRHEPELALASGEDGLDFTRELLANAADFLTDDGLLVVEVGASADALTQAFPEVPFVWLELRFGGEGVFLLDRAALNSHTSALP